MNEKTPTTNAMRQLTRQGITFQTKVYLPDEDDLSGVHVASQIGIDPQQVFKTLVAKGDKTGFLTCGLPVDRTVDLKKLASVSGNKRVDLIPTKDLLAVTGYVRGGCSPVGMKKKFTYYLADLDEQFKQESEALAARLEAAHQELVPLNIRPNKQEIQVRALVLVWMPYLESANGTEEPVWV